MYPQQQPFAQQPLAQQSFAQQPYEDMSTPYRPPYGPGQYPSYQQTPSFPGTTMGYPSPGFQEPSYNVEARLDRLEREILEINRRLNLLTRRVRRIESFLNIRDEA